MGLRAKLCERAQLLKCLEMGSSQGLEIPILYTAESPRKGDTDALSHAQALYIYSRSTGGYALYYMHDESNRAYGFAKPARLTYPVGLAASLHDSVFSSHSLSDIPVSGLPGPKFQPYISVAPAIVRAQQPSFIHVNRLATYLYAVLATSVIQYLLTADH